MLGFFMVGAYQEILIVCTTCLAILKRLTCLSSRMVASRLAASDEGDTVADMLQYVQLDPKTLLTHFRDRVNRRDIWTMRLRQQFLEEFEAGLYGYTYLEDE